MARTTATPARPATDRDGPSADASSPARDGARNGARNGTRAERGQGVPTQLATRTDLTAEQSKAVADAVNPLIADAIAFWVKLKNYHWHLSGIHFRDFHLMFDEFAETVLASVDIMAERVRRVGGTTVRSIGHVASLQTIPDDDEPFVDSLDMIRRLLEDEERMAESIRKAIESCEDAKDEPTANRLEEVLDEIERQKWFLFEIAQGNGAER